MEKFVAIEYWDYMDMHPNTEVRTFIGDDEKSLKENVDDFVAHMKSHWCSGTTRLIGIMTAEEAKKYIDEQIAKEHQNWQDDSQEFIDRITNLYKKCYETEN